MRGGVWGVRHWEGPAAQAERHLESRQAGEDFCKKLAFLFLEENNLAIVFWVGDDSSGGSWCGFDCSRIHQGLHDFHPVESTAWGRYSDWRNVSDDSAQVRRQVAGLVYWWTGKFWDHTKFTKPIYLALPSLAPSINHPCTSSRCTQVGWSRTAVAWFQAEARKRSTNPFDGTGNWRELGERRETSFHNWAAGEWESK